MTIADFCTANKIPKSTAISRLDRARKTDASIAPFLGSREVQPREKTIILGVATRTKTAQKPTKSRAKKTPNDAQHLRAEVSEFAHDFTRKIEPETAQDFWEFPAPDQTPEVAQEPRKNDAQEPTLFRARNDVDTAITKARRLGKLRAKIRREVARSYAFDSIMAGIAVGHAGLIWYDCASLWNTPGLIGGGLAFLMVIGALVIATDKDKASTSQDAMYFIFVVDCAAGFAHFAVFSEDSTAGFWPTTIFSAFICLCSYVALYLFRNSKNAW